MKLSKKMHDTLNRQITLELTAEHNYLAMAAWFDHQDLEGFAHYFKKQAEEEHGHAMKIYNYVNDRDEKVSFGQVPMPKSSWKKPLEVAKDALKNEEMNTKAINALMALAKKENDFATEAFLKWFVDEQVEEEDQANLLISKLEFIKDNGHGLIELDKDLAKRTE